MISLTTVQLMADLCEHLQPGPKQQISLAISEHDQQVESDAAKQTQVSAHRDVFILSTES